MFQSIFYTALEIFIRKNGVYSIVGLAFNLDLPNYETSFEAAGAFT
jgi:hypothetical protein